MDRGGISVGITVCVDWGEIVEEGNEEGIGELDPHFSWL